MKNNTKAISLPINVRINNKLHTYNQTTGTYQEANVQY